MVHVQAESCVIERLMGIVSPSIKQPIKKRRVFSDSYLQKMSPMGIRRKQQLNEKRLSWMDTDEFVFDVSYDISMCSSMEQNFNIEGLHLSGDGNLQPSAGFSPLFEVLGGCDKDVQVSPHSPQIDFSESSNSFGSQCNEMLVMQEHELSLVPYFSGSVCYSSSISRSKTGLSPAKCDEMKGQLDSFRLVKSLEDYQSGNRRRVQRDDKERQSNMNNLQSFTFRRRIYTDLEREVAAHIRHIKDNVKLSNSKVKSGYSSEPEESTATPLVFIGLINHQRMQCETPNSSFNDPCLRAIQAIKGSRRISKVPNNGQKDAVTSKTCINSSKKLRHLSCPDPKVARKNSTVLKSLTDNGQDLGLQHICSMNMAREKTCSSINMSMPTLVHPNEPISDVSYTNTDSGLMVKGDIRCINMLTEIRKLPPSETTLLAANHIPSDVLDDSKNLQGSMLAFPEIVLDTFLCFEPLSPRSSEEDYQHSPVSVLESSSNAGALSVSDHFKHVSPELQELRMQLQLLEPDLPEGSEGSVTAFVRDSRWLDLGEDIHAIGSQLESSLIDELIEELVYT